jgi:transposase-like protein
MKTLNSFNSIALFVEAFKTENKCRKYLMNILWENAKPVCPHCGNTGKCYKFANTGKFKCSECLMQFKVTAKTMFEGTHLPLTTWFLAIYLIAYHNKGISSVQLAQYLNVTQKTAWFLLHRIRQAQKENQLPFTGTVEADESYFGGTKKGNKQGRSVRDKQAVMGIVERGGRVALAPITRATAQILESQILSSVDRDARIITDSFSGYYFLKEKYPNHKKIDHSTEYVHGDVHTNTIEGVWGLFKRALFGIYHSVSRYHLNAYCVEFAYRYNTRKLNAQAKFDGILVNVFGKRIKYAELIAH